MPSIKDFDKKKAKKIKLTDLSESKPAGLETQGMGHAQPKRRPGREAQNVVDGTEVKVVDVEKGVTMEGKNQSEANQSENTQAQPSQEGVQFETAGQAQAAGDKIEIKFPGSEILRAKFSRPFDVAEAVATEWVNNGQFEALPLGHPLAQYFAAKGLQKAKQVEKKVLESPVTEKVAMQVLTAGMKAQEIISQVRSKIKK